MKRKIKIIGMLALASLFSCQKDTMEVIKNLDTSWSVDNKVIENDIRNRLGFDPRFNYVLTEQTEFNFPMLSLGDLPITGQNTQQIEIKILKPLDKDLNVSLEYNAELFEKVKTNFAGYSLGAEDLITIAQKQKVIPQGETSITFDVVVTNNSKFKDKMLVPFVFKTDDQQIKVVENYDKVLFKVYNEEVTYTYPKKVTKSLILDDKYSKMLRIPVLASNQILDQITLSFQRINVNVSNPAPQDAEGMLPVDFDFTGKNKFDFKWDLDIQSLEEGENYQLSFQIQAKIGNESYILPQDILVILDTNFTENENLHLGEANVGIPIEKSTMKASGAQWYSPRLIDNNLENKVYILKNNTVKLDFGQEKLVNSVNIYRNFEESYSIRYFNSIDVYVENQGQEIKIGTMTSITGKEVILNLHVPIKADALIFKNIHNDQFVQNYWYVISEIDIYQE